MLFCVVLIKQRKYLKEILYGFHFGIYELPISCALELLVGRIRALGLLLGKIRVT